MEAWGGGGKPGDGLVEGRVKTVEWLGEGLGKGAVWPVEGREKARRRPEKLRGIARRGS